MGRIPVSIPPCTGQSSSQQSRDSRLTPGNFRFVSTVRLSPALRESGFLHRRCKESNFRPMDSDRKYRQRGYMESDRDYGPGRDDRPRHSGPRPPLDVTGPRLPRMVQTVTASRCWNCAVTLPSGVDFRGNCPKCNTPLHCCKQCAHFEPSTRFQCLKPIPARISPKDTHNECEWFSPRVTVAREVSSSANTAPVVDSPRSPADARAAFDNLFKK
jgi:hypothetical protein